MSSSHHPLSEGWASAGGELKDHAALRSRFCSPGGEQQREGERKYFLHYNMHTTIIHDQQGQQWQHVPHSDSLGKGH